MSEIRIDRRSPLAAALFIASPANAADGICSHREMCMVFPYM